MALFKQNKNKRFNYIPRHLKEQESQILEQLESKRLASKHLSRHQGKASSTLLVLILILGTVIALLYVLDNYKN